MSWDNKRESSHFSTNVCKSFSATFLQLRMSLTCEDLEACGPPFAIASEISSLYILHARQDQRQAIVLSACENHQFSQYLKNALHQVPIAMQVRESPSQMLSQSLSKKMFPGLCHLWNHGTIKGWPAESIFLRGLRGSYLLRLMPVSALRSCQLKSSQSLLNQFNASSKSSFTCRS